MIRLTFILILLFLGCAYEPQNGDTPEEEWDFENSLDIMTWNLNYYNVNDLDKKIWYLDSLIQFSNIDIIAIQEIESQNGPYFSTLINALNDSESQYIWEGYKPNGWNWLAYIINTSTVDVSELPYTILNSYGYEFAGRYPYVLKISVSNEDYYIINNHFKAYGDAESESRREKSSIYLKTYIDTYLSDENVIVLGDLNDSLTDPEEENVFWNFLSDPDKYLFVDMEIAQGSPENWSYPAWGTAGSHPDHILVTNELFDYVGEVQTILYDLDNDGDSDEDDWSIYEYYITDHRPVRVSIIICMNEDDVCSE